MWTRPRYGCRNGRDVLIRVYKKLVKSVKIWYNYKYNNPKRLKEERPMKTMGEKRKDKDGITWFVNTLRTTRYPNGGINVLVLETACGGLRTFVRYDEIGNPIAGELSLA